MIRRCSIGVRLSLRDECDITRSNRNNRGTISTQLQPATASPADDQNSPFCSYDAPYLVSCCFWKNPCICHVQTAQQRVMLCSFNQGRRDHRHPLPGKSVLNPVSVAHHQIIHNYPKAIHSIINVYRVLVFPC